MAEPVTGTFLGVLWDRLFEWGVNGSLRFLFRRLVRLPDEVGKIEVRLRGENPVDFCLNCPVPSVSAWLEVVNHSRLNLRLDRMDLRIWAGQPIVTGTMARRHACLRQSTTRDIAFESQLVPAAVAQTTRNYDQPTASFIVAGTAFFESSLGPVEVNFNLKRSACRPC